jgi:hypothetical protein
MIRGVVLLGGMREKATQSGEEESDPKTDVRFLKPNSVVSGVSYEPLAQEGADQNAK